MRALLRFLKIEHTLFSLPYLFAGAFLAKRGFTDLRETGLILLAGIGARAAGMGLNRIIDRHIDAANPRTANRELPAGRLSLGAAWASVVFFSGLLVLAAWLLNPLCFLLSPVPLLAFWLYPYTKRWTPLTHFALGAAWSIAPGGAWLAITGSFAGFFPGGVLALSVLFWLAGFDIIYATQDVEFDRKHGIKSLPAALGVDRALWISRASHGISFCLWVYLGFLTGMKAPYFAALGFIAVLFLLEHFYAKKNPQLSFFKINAVLGFSFLLGIVGGLV